MAVFKSAGTARVTYQGVPCLEAEYTNPQGTQSGAGYVVMTAEGFAELRIDGSDAWAPLPAGPLGTTERDPGAGGAIPALGAGLKIRGDLVFERVGDTAVPLIGLYVTEAGVKEVTRSAEFKLDRGKVRVPLGDIRMLWGRGDMGGPYNVTRRGVAIRGFSQTVDRPDAEGLGFLPESLRPDGKPYTLADLIRICLRRLPGRLTLSGPAAEIAAAEDIVPVNLMCAGESALSVLNGLLAAWNFRFVYDCFGNTAQVWRFDVGKPAAEDSGGVLTSLAMPTAAKTIQVDPKGVPSRFRLQRFFYRPRAVRVVGRPIIREVRVDGLELVGELPNGTVAPLDDCLAAITVPNAAVLGPFNKSNPDDLSARPPVEKAAPSKARRGMTRAELARWVLLNQDEQRAWRDGALTSDAIAALRRWGFKWFRLPESAAPFTPILSYRARAVSAGRPAKPAVFADLFDEVSFEAWGKSYQEAIAALQNIRFDFLTSTDTNDPVAAVQEALSPGLFGIFTGGNTIGPDGSIEVDLPADVRTRIIDEVLEQFNAADNAVRARIAQESKEIAESEANEIRFFNLYRRKVNPALYEVDPTGVVRFARVIGAVQLAPGRGADVSLEQAAGPARRFNGLPVYVSEGAALETNPRVSIIFAYESSPRARRAAPSFGPGYSVDPSGDKTSDSYKDLYNFLGTLEASKDAKGSAATVTHLNPAGIDPPNAADLFPRVVRHDMKLYVDIDGRSNEADLDAFARSVVRRELEGETQMRGEEGEASAYYPLQPTGAVSSITWALRPTKRGALAKTRWNVGDESQLRARGMTMNRSTGTNGLGTLPGGVTTSQENPR